MKKITEMPKLKPRKPDAHKGNFGRVCIIGGSLGMSGAAALSGRASLRSGAGLVRIATAKSVLPVIASIEPCCTTIPLAEDGDGRIDAKAIDKILEITEDNDIIAFGPGIGISSGLQTILQKLIAKDIKLVVDADGLNNLAKIKNWHENKIAKMILTPHPGEMQRLWQGTFREQMPEDRQKTAGAYSQKTACTLVLKGFESIVADGDKIYVNNTGNPGMATGGSGDVLTGVITALWGQGLSQFDAASLGTYIHGLAGDKAAEDKTQISMIATDIIDFLGEALKTLL